ncbi:MAG: hypothetical protein FWD16_07785, partial [Clostridia bacterium]|nr:hypothetical protein [Clostridia bacterium]
MKKTLTLRALAALLCLLLALTLMPGCSVSFGGGGGGGGGVGAALLPEDTVEDIKQTEDLCGKIAEIVQ